MTEQVLVLNRKTVLANTPADLDIYPFAHVDYNLRHNSAGSDVGSLPRHIVDKSNDADEIGKLFPQILTYIIVRKGDKYLSYSRAGSEKLLTAKKSIGVGGHANPPDLDEWAIKEYSLMDAIINSGGRELEEELGLAKYIDPDDVKYVIDSSADQVSSRHVAFVVFMDIDEDHELHMSDEIHEPNWISKDDLLEACHLYENWSQLVINYAL